ncbi:MAG: menaquinone-dependent protoporphyrinogen IX dehydrogenase [Propionivibrio sp.]|uniref:menaquinone-dependent protoporphyrinogen IX dehydrogenase n=1 Tax=Propionivibrio sp. TaxID=2212460 RepID=UPI001A4040F8|nr:menaquinone-dependent protoporphyrinogen IX dehydrogenase [Propionivibrio sp.]MBL8413337.1 menaquinone-dependent protoporphyrinogen IX dehydrogenase [Propionivibrio sp.]
MANILILFSSTDGHTKKIGKRLKQVIEESSNHVTLVPVDDFRQVDLDFYDKIIIGASIRYGKHNPLVLDFINSHLQLLESKSNAFFSVNIVARKKEKNRPETNPYMRKFLKQIAWRPKKLAVFAGKLDYPKYRFFDRLMIRLIMLMTKGPTDPSTVVEFTDWQKVDEFAHLVRDM